MKDGVYLTTEAKRRWQREYYLRHREKCKESSLQYRETHKDQIAVYQKRYSMTHDRSEYFRERWKRKKEAERTEAELEWLKNEI